MSSINISFSFSCPSGDMTFVSPKITVEHFESCQPFELVFLDALNKFVKEFCRKYEDEQWWLWKI